MVNNFCCTNLYEILDATNFARSKTFGHNAAQAEVFWVIHIDHGSEEFIELNRQITDVGTLATAEQ